MENQAFVAFLKPTHKCNLNCLYCYDKSNRLKYKDSELSIENINRLAKLIETDYSNALFIWVGGEPTCLPIEYYEKCEEAFACSYRLFKSENFLTNGINLNKDWIKFVQYADIDLLISYDGKGETRKGINHNDVENNIKLCNELGKEVSINITVNKTNINEINNIYEKLLDLGVRDIIANIVYPYNNEEDSKIFMTPLELYEAYIDFMHNQINKSSPFEGNSFSYLTYILGSAPLDCKHIDCRGKFIGVEPDGSIYPCCGCFPEKYHCGYIKDYTSINEVFNSKGYDLFSKEIDYKYQNYCNQCVYLEYCQGGCHTADINRFGNAKQPDFTQCQYIEALLKAAYVNIREIDLENHRINTNLFEFLINFNCFLPMEIKSMIKELYGIDYSFETNEKIFTMGKDFVDTIEYKVLKIINGKFYTIDPNLIEKNMLKYKKYGVTQDIEQFNPMVIEARKKILKDLILNKQADLMRVLNNN